MPTTVFTATHSLALINVTDTGTQLSWTNTAAITDPHTVTDQNDDTNHDINLDTHGAGGTFTGYVVEAGGRSYGVYNSGGNYAISYNSSLHDISGLVPATGATTTIVDNAKLANCFFEGTKIATPHGERLVEGLAIGDHVRTADGRDVPVKWVGRQRIARAVNTVHSEGRAPVCIQAGTLGTHSDLYVSADHGMIVSAAGGEAVGDLKDGLVINAAALVNGTTVRFVPVAELPESFVYYHIETEAHEVILANGAASETFADAIGRSAFDNHQDYLDLYGADRLFPETKLPRIAAPRLVPQDIKDRLNGAATSRSAA